MVMDCKDSEHDRFAFLTTGRFFPNFDTRPKTFQRPKDTPLSQGEVVNNWRTFLCARWSFPLHSDVGNWTLRLPRVALAEPVSPVLKGTWVDRRY